MTKKLHWFKIGDEIPDNAKYTGYFNEKYEQFLYEVPVKPELNQCLFCMVKFDVENGHWCVKD